MSITTRMEALSTTPEQILPVDASRTAVWFRNEDAAIVVRVGGSTVTASGTPATAGFSIPPGEIVPFISSPQGGDNVAAMEWWAVAESGTPNLSVLTNDQFS